MHCLYRLFKREKEIDTKVSKIAPSVKCAGVECEFEFICYSYQGGQDEIVTDC